METISENDTFSTWKTSHKKKPVAERNANNLKERCPSSIIQASSGIQSKKTV